MWTWLMGTAPLSALGFTSSSTLVEIVADVFTGVSSALSTIMSNIDEFAVGVKVVGQFIADAVIVPALKDAKGLIIYLFSSIFETIQSQTSLTYSLLTNGFQFTNNGKTNTIELVINSIDLSLDIIINSNKVISLSNLLFSPSLNIETLSLDTAIIASTIGLQYIVDGFGLIPILVNNLAGWADAVFGTILSFISSFVFQLLTYLLLGDETDRSEYAEFLVMLHNAAGWGHTIGSLLSPFAFRAAGTPFGKVFSILKENWKVIGLDVAQGIGHATITTLIGLLGAQISQSSKDKYVGMLVNSVILPFAILYFVGSLTIMKGNINYYGAIGKYATLQGYSHLIMSLIWSTFI